MYNNSNYNNNNSDRDRDQILISSTGNHVECINSYNINDVTHCINKSNVTTTSKSCNTYESSSSSNDVPENKCISSRDKTFDVCENTTMS